MTQIQTRPAGGPQAAFSVVGRPMSSATQVQVAATQLPAAVAPHAGVVAAAAESKTVAGGPPSPGPAAAGSIHGEPETSTPVPPEVTAKQFEACVWLDLPLVLLLLLCRLGRWGSATTQMYFAVCWSASKR